MQNVCALILLAASLAAAAPPVQTFTYKRVGPLEIKADVYLPGAGRRPYPVMVYIHGGSLIDGGRDRLEKVAIKDLLLAEGIAVVSIDYRLAPETKLPGIIEDIEDAFRWVREKGPALFGADPNRVGTAGASAGGYLTLVTGFRIHPRPRVLVAESSYGDLVGPWQTNPSRHQPHYQSHLSREEAWQQVSGPPIANAKDRKGKGGAFNDFIRRNAEWPKAVSGWDAKTETDKFVPYMPVRNVTAEYPPTFLMHGEADTDVPFEQPRAMAAGLARHNVEYRLVGVPGGEHGYKDGDQKVIDAGRREAVAFVRKHLLQAPAGGALSAAASAPAEQKSFTFAGLKLLPDPWDKAANYKKLEDYCRRAAAAGADFIVTPEGYLEGYVGSAKTVKERTGVELTRERYFQVGEPVDGPWMKKIAGLARELKKYIMVGFAELRGDKMYNSIALYSPQGERLARYSKSHCGPPQEPFNTPGDELQVYSTPIGRLGLLICFDRQLPETSRILAIKGAQMIIVPAFGLNTSEINEDIMMRTRAYENSVYVAHVHPINTFVVDPKGNIVAQNRGNDEAIVMAKITLDKRIGANKAFTQRRPEIYGDILKK